MMHDRSRSYLVSPTKPMKPGITGFKNLHQTSQSLPLTHYPFL